jgi:hypothetical protein
MHALLLGRELRLRMRYGWVLGLTLVSATAVAGGERVRGWVHVLDGSADHAGARAQFPEYPYDGRFVFARIYYDMGGGMRSFGRRGRDQTWLHDYPDAEQNFTAILRELTYVWPMTEGGNIFALDDPRLTQFPIAYMSEPGFWDPTDQEALALRNYLLKGGFIIFDDFGGGGDQGQMSNLVYQMNRVLPELTFLPLDASDEVFDSFFGIDPETINLVYNRYRTEWWGLFEENDKSKRMLAVAGNYGDLGEFWEYSSRGYFPVDMSNEAYKVGINYIVYALTH